MPNICVIPGCKSNYPSELKINRSHVSTFSFPKDNTRKEAWLRAIPRKNWTPTTYSSICIKHFHERDVIKVQKWKKPNGELHDLLLDKPRLSDNAVPQIFENLPSNCKRKWKPASLKDTDNADWVPTLNMGYGEGCSNVNTRLQRDNRLAGRHTKEERIAKMKASKVRSTRNRKCLLDNPESITSEDDIQEPISQLNSEETQSSFPTSCNFEEVYIKEEALEEIPDEVNENVHKENNPCLRIKEENIETIPIKQEYVEEEELNKDTNSCNVSGDYEMCNTKSATKFDDIVVKEEPIESESADTELYTTLVENIKKESL